MKNSTLFIKQMFGFIMAAGLSGPAFPGVEDIYRVNDTTVVLEWAGGRATLHHILTGAPIPADPQRIKNGEINDVDMVDTAVKALRNRRVAARFNQSDSRTMDDAGILYACSRLDSHQVSVDIYSPVTDSLSTSYLYLSTVLEGRDLRLRVSPHGRYLGIAAQEGVSSCVNYILRLPALTTVRKTGKGCISSFSPNDSVAVFFDGCVCEGQDGRTFTYVNIENPKLRLRLDMASVVDFHQDEPRFQDSLLWAAKGRYLRVWSLNSLSLIKKFNHQGIYRRHPEYHDPTLYDAFLFAGGDSLLVLNAAKGRLRVFVNDGKTQTTILDTVTGPLVGAFFVGPQRIISMVNRKGEFSTMPVPLLLHEQGKR